MNEDFEKRLAHIEKVLVGQAVSKVEEKINENAKVMTLWSLVKELAEHEGISPEDLNTHYNLRYKFHQAEALGDAEDQNPELAAAVDTRPQQSVPTGEPYPPLFPKQTDRHDLN
jgi:hypothetical protein